MDVQDILKATLNSASSNRYPICGKFLGALAISATKKDPIDREEAYYNDALDFVENFTTFFILKYSFLFADPDSCRESFRRAIAAEKFLLQQQANQARAMRAEHQSS